MEEPIPINHLANPFGVDPHTAVTIQQAIRIYSSRIYYSQKYEDSHYEYRHVILPKQLFAHLKQSGITHRLWKESEWRAIGVQGSPGWYHYALHNPEPHILLFRRPLSSLQNHR